jgi:putative transport protein
VRRDDVVSFLTERPILLLILLVGVGALAGGIRVRRVALGPAAALFCGLAVSAYDERLALPAELATLGLVLFAYTIGVAAGPQLRALAGRRGLRIVAAVAGCLVLGALVAFVAATVIDLEGGGVGGLFAGALTNTPALAAVTAREPGPDAAVAYSLAYPIGVVVPLLVAHALQRRPRADAADDAGPTVPVITWTVRVDEGVGPLGDLRSFNGEALAFGRFEHAGIVDIATTATVLAPGDLVTVIGAEDAVHAFADHVGQRADRHLPLDRRRLDFRRVIVSNREVSGHRLGDLDLGGRFGATVTRVRRGDVDLVADDDIVVQLGDRLRVVGVRDRLDDVAAYLGDSLHELADIDVAALGIGIVAGMLLGQVPIPVPGGTLELGDAGGTLLVGLLVGARRRLGRLHFDLPVEENLVLRNFGTVVLLAVIGSRSGAAFASAVTSWSGLQTVAAGASVTVVVALTAAWLLRRVTGGDTAEAAGMLAGVQTQPAVLAAAQDAAADPTPVGFGYAAAYPVAMVAKLILAQLLVT